MIVFRPSSTKITAEAQHGLISQIIKDVVFSRRPGVKGTEGVEQITEVVDSSSSMVVG